MEGLIFFIAMIVFIVRTVNKIKKTASGGKKAQKVKHRKTPHIKDKLEQLIRNMEESERLKKEGAAHSGDEEVFTSSGSGRKESSGNKDTVTAGGLSPAGFAESLTSRAGEYSPERSYKKVHTEENSAEYNTEEYEDENDYRKRESDKWMENGGKSQQVC